MFTSTKHTKEEFLTYVLEKVKRFYPGVAVYIDNQLLHVHIYDVVRTLDLTEIWEQFMQTGNLSRVMEKVEGFLEWEKEEKAVEFQQENIFSAIRTLDFINKELRKGNNLMYKPLQEDLVIVYFYPVGNEICYITKEIEKAFEDHWYIPDIARENIAKKDILHENDEEFQHQFLVKRFYQYKKGERFFFSLPTFKKTYVFPLKEKDDNFEKEAVRKLKKMTLQAYASSQMPLSLRVYVFENGKIKTVL